MGRDHIDTPVIFDLEFTWLNTMLGRNEQCPHPSPLQVLYGSLRRTKWEEMDILKSEWLVFSISSNRGTCGSLLTFALHGVACSHGVSHRKVRGPDMHAATPGLSSLSPPSLPFHPQHMALSDSTMHKRRKTFTWTTTRSRALFEDFLLRPTANHFEMKL